MGLPKTSGNVTKLVYLSILQLQCTLKAKCVKLKCALIERNITNYLLPFKINVKSKNQLTFKKQVF